MRQGYAERFLAVRDALALAPTPRTDSPAGVALAPLTREGIWRREHLGKATGAIDRLLALSPTGTLDLRAGWMKHHQQCNWKMVMENNVDGYHAACNNQAASVA